jgi:hypothetical protein
MKRTIVLAGALTMCASVQGCVAGTGEESDGPGEALESASAALVVGSGSCGERDPTFVCDYRLFVTQGLAQQALPYCASEDLAPVNPDGTVDITPLRHVRRLIIAQHGRGSDGRSYLSTLSKAAGDAVGAGLIASGENFVIAPQFIEPVEACANGQTEADLEGLFQWGSYGPEYDWAIGGLSSLPGAPFARSSFELLERLLDLALSRMPNLEEIIFAGQSAGGQLVQRYAALNDYAFPSDVDVRYVPANPFAVLYVDGQRPNVNAPGFSTPTFASWPGDEVCTGLGNSCNDYDDYPLGLQAIPASHYAAGAPLASIPSVYAARDVTYLVGEADVTHREQCGCGDQIQGENRRTRIQRLSEYMKQEHGAFFGHNAVIVPDFGHGGGVFRQPCGYAALFGFAYLCDPLEEHELGQGWSGSIVSVAMGNVDADPAEELAVIERSGFTTRVRVLDDEASGYATLYEPSQAWGWLQLGQEVAFGDVNGDGIDELAVARATSSGDSWFVYRRYGNGTWVTLDSGGSDWPAPVSATHVAFGDVNGDGEEELAVTRNATSGARCYLYRYAAGGGIVNEHPLELTHSSGSGWASGVRASDAAFGDVDGDGLDELVVSRDAESGARLYVYQLHAALESRAIGSGWVAGNIVRHVAVGNVDKDAAAEIVFGRDVVLPGYSRWGVVDDAASYAVIRQGGFDWDGESITSLALGAIDRSRSYPTLAVGVAGGGASRLELMTFQVYEDQLVVGDFSRVVPPGGASVRSVALGDVDGLGGDEIAYGVLSAQQAGYGVRVLPAP